MAQVEQHDVAAFTQRIEAMLSESREHVEGLAARRVALINEREGEIARIKENYRAKLDKIDADLAAMRRIERAIHPDAPKPQRANGANGSTNGHRPASKPPAFIPSEEKREAVLLALTERERATVVQLAETVGFSTTTVKFALDYMRDEHPSLVRLAGQGKNNVRIWAATKDGERAATKAMEA
jgi:hypothetical protein